MPVRLRPYPPMKITAEELPAIERRFMSKIQPEPNTGCWLWDGAVFNEGYGLLKIRNKPVGAHRVSLLLATGRWPEKLTLHKCNVRLCVNPDHLYEGTHTDNMRDAQAAGTLGKAVGEAIGNAKLTDETVADIRRSYASGTKTQQEIAAEYGLNQATVSLVTSRRTWRHVPQE